MCRRFQMAVFSPRIEFVSITKGLRVFAVRSVPLLWCLLKPGPKLPSLYLLVVLRLVKEGLSLDSRHEYWVKLLVAKCWKKGLIAGVQLHIRPVLTSITLLKSQLKQGKQQKLQELAARYKFEVPDVLKKCPWIWSLQACIAKSLLHNFYDVYQHILHLLTHENVMRTWLRS